jgi:hypothetical protein
MRKKYMLLPWKMVVVCGLNVFFGRKFAVCFANPQLSFMAKRQKSSDAAAHHFSLCSIYFF